jgi:hypothetical protein
MCGGNEIINVGTVSDFIPSEEFCDLPERLVSSLIALGHMTTDFQDLLF